MTETLSAPGAKGASLFREPPTLAQATFASKTEEMCGDVILQGPDKQKRYVHLKVYRTSLEHFAVVYPLKRLSKPLGIINIRNTCIAPAAPASPPAATSGSGYSSATVAATPVSAKTGFTINQRMFDVNTSVTLLCDASALPAWLNAFTSSRCSPTLVHQTSLPIVQEEDSD